jgi:retinol dehydrogenase-12
MSWIPPFLIRQLFVTPPIPKTSFSGQTIIITGANVGLGFEAARHVLRLGASHLILGCRNLSAGEAAASQLRSTSNKAEIEVWPLDLASFESVRQFARRANDLSRLDTLFANAGLHTETFKLVEGHETTITVNVLSTAYLCLLLHPKLKSTAAQTGTQTHITVTSSELYRQAKFAEADAPQGRIFDALKKNDPTLMADRYNVSKLLDYIFVRAMAELKPLEGNGVVVNCVAPG